jgi:hypothetical protein
VATLGMVCRGWHELIHSVGSFWSRYEIIMDHVNPVTVNALDALLLRSKDSLLTFCLDAYRLEHEDGFDVPSCSHIFDSLLQHSERWIDVEITLIHSFRERLGGTPCDFPMLQHLSLTGPDIVVTGLPFLGDVIEVHTLVLESAIPSPAVTLPQLKELRLHGQHHMGLFSLLAQCASTLRKLYLDCLWFEDQAELPIRGLNLITLPFVQTLDIVYMFDAEEDDEVSQVLDFLILPSLSILYLQFHEDQGVSGTLLEHLKHLITRSRCSIQEVSTSSVKHDDELLLTTFFSELPSITRINFHL